MASEQDIITQIEYYLSDKNLERDEFFHKAIENSEDGYVLFELFAKCNKIKKMEISVEDMVKALQKSTQCEVDVEGKRIRRKDNEKLPGLIAKKLKKNNENDEKNGNEEEEKLVVKIVKPANPLNFAVATEQKSSAMHWKLLEEILQKSFDIKPVYVRYSKIGNEGNFIIDKSNIEQETIDRMLKEGIKVGKEYEAKITLCEGEELEQFFQQHGSHYDQCMELAAMGKAAQDSKKKKMLEKKEKRRKQMIYFAGEKFVDISHLKNSFKGILGRTANGERIKEPYHEMLLELIKFHQKYTEKSKDLDYFTVDIHPQYKDTRCFFVANKNGEKEDFSFTKCLIRLEELKNNGK